MEEREVGTYEMLWDCPYCDTPKLLGLTHRHCPNCGGAQNPEARYFPSDEDKVAVADHRYYGADIVCPACDTPNSAAASFCTGCGGPLEGGKEAIGRSDQLQNAAGGFDGETIRDAKAEARARREAVVAAAQGKAPPAPGMSRGAKIAIIVGSIALLIGVLVAVLVFWKKEVALEVDRLTWERTIAVERFDTVSESAWCDQMPRGAFSVSKSKEVRETKKVPDGKTCTKRRKDNKDGTFKEVQECKTKYREEPVYDMKCRYRIDRWKTVRTEEAQGQGRDPAPSWPTVTLAKKGNCRGCEREGRRREIYTIHLVDASEGETHECDVDAERWNAVDVGSRFKAEVGIVSSSLDCDSLVPAS